MGKSIAGLEVMVFGLRGKIRGNKGGGGNEMIVIEKVRCRNLFLRSVVGKYKR